MEDLRLFAVVGITTPPVELKRSEDLQAYACPVPQPLPPQLLVFSQGDWPSEDLGNVTLDVMLASQKIGQMSSEARCFSWDTSNADDIKTDKTLTLELKVVGLKNQPLSNSKTSAAKKVAKASAAGKSKKAAVKEAENGIVSSKNEKMTKSKLVNEKKKMSVPDTAETTQDENANVPVSGKNKELTAKTSKNAPVMKAVSPNTCDMPSAGGEKKTRQTQLSFFEKKLSPGTELKRQVVREEKSKLTLVLPKYASESEAQRQKRTKELMQTKLEELSAVELVEDSSEDSHDIQVLNETTPLMPDMPSPLPRKPAKSKKRKSDDGEKTPDGVTPRKRGTTSTRMRALTSEAGTPKAARKKAALGDAASTENIILPAEDGKEVLKSEGKMSRCIDLSGRAPRPSPRWGHTMLLTQPRCAVLIGGQGERQQLSRDSVWTLHTETRKWNCQEIQSEGQKPENRMGHTATYDPTVRCIYIFGGSKNSRWFHDVHVYDLDENKWTLAKVNGKAPTRAYHTATLYRHELWIFGGVYPRPDPNPDGCSNDIHIFSPVMQNWYTPLVMGEKPLPRSGHSATLINDQLVMFGGWDAPFCYNDLFVLDMTTLDWSKPDVKGTPPKPRSWHASCALSGRRILIHGGYDGDNALGDTFIFDLGSLSWNSLVISNAPCARAGHAAVCLPYNYENQEEDEVMIFGGGDNDGAFYQDLLSLCIPFHPVVQAD
ncbi:hypothetical protein BaRGS_00036569 [Batillaria attramentaria]|uniref:Kelch repeat-containing protein n=1 Tax=Batillaria attramentaria TaxID=370345 RepID=A0ABD0JBP1_9CAEN